MKQDPERTARSPIDDGYEPFEDADDARTFLSAAEQAERERREAQWREQEDRQDEHSAETRALRHVTRAAELESIARKLDSASDGRTYKAASLIIGREDKRLTDDEFQTFHRAAAGAVHEAKLAREIRQQAKRERRKAERIKVKSEPRVYGVDSPHSWYEDVARVTAPEAMVSLFPDFRSATDSTPEERLARYGAELVHEVRNKSKEGRHVERVLREHTRHEDETIHRRKYAEAMREVRALTTGGGSTASAAGGSAAAVVSPFFLLDETALFRGVERAFADSCHSVPLPKWGMEFYVPAFSTTDAVGQQSEQIGAPAQPTVTGSGTGSTVTVGTYTVAVTYVTSSGETTASATNTVTTTSGQNIVVTSPAAVYGATAWYAYISQVGVSSPLTRQQAAGSPTAIGTNLTLTATPTNTGANPPASNTSGAVTETDPATGLQGNAVQTITGMLTITQQLNDRAYRGGGSVDVLIQRQLMQQLEEKIDLYALNTVIGAGGAPSGVSTTWSMANFYSDIALGREGITDTAGVRLRPTHAFTSSDLFSYVTKQVDSSGRPIVVPTFAPGFPLVQGADVDDQTRQKWSRFTGTVLPASVLWFTDDNIPASGSNTQIIVSAPDEAVIIAESPQPVLTVFPQYGAGSLEIGVNLRSYVCVIARHASGTQILTSAAYPTTLK